MLTDEQKWEKDRLIAAFEHLDTLITRAELLGITDEIYKERENRRE